MEERKIYTDIRIDGTPVPHFNSLTIQQEFNRHHRFGFSVNADVFGTALGGFSLADSRKFIGKKLVAQYGSTPDMMQIFVGIITSVELAQGHGHRGNVILNGSSPTILIDRGADLGSYKGRTLQDIVDSAISEVDPRSIQLNNNPQKKGTIPYLIQYKESDFAFLNRLAHEYHEWFFFDGYVTYFGRPDGQKEVRLLFGKDVDNLQQSLYVSPLTNNKFAYHSPNNELLSAKAPRPDTGDENLAASINASQEVYNKVYNQPVSVRVDNKQDIEEFVKNEQDAIAASLVQIAGSSKCPDLRLGCKLTLELSKTSFDGQFDTEPIGSFTITGVSHYFTGVNTYENSFEGISADAKRMPHKGYARPQAELQIASVVANNDSLGQGRVQVRFNWQCATNHATEWIRVMTPDAGSSDKVSTNRGFVFIPEVGDQVLVGFEEGNVARPFVIGSLHHGKNGTGGGSGNNGKSLTSKSGHTLVMNDGGGITIKDKTGGNLIFIDGKDQITITSTKKINIVSEEINLNASKDINLNAGNAINLNAQPGEKGGGLGNLTISAKKTISATSDTDSITLISTTKDVSINAPAGKGNLSAKDVVIAATTKTDISGASQTHITGGEVEINKS